MSKGVRWLACIMLISADVKAQNGETLFRQYCGICHTIGNGRLVGPDLKGITFLRSEEWLLKWTKDSQGFIKSGDTAAKNIFLQFNNIIMPNPPLQDADLKAVFSFIASKGPPSSAIAGANEIVAENSKNSSAYKIIFGWNNPITYLFVFILLIIFLSVHTVQFASRVLKEEDIKTTHFMLNNNFGRLFKWLTTYQTHFGIQLFIIILLGIIGALVIV